MSVESWPKSRPLLPPQFPQRLVADNPGSPWLTGLDMLEGVKHRDLTADYPDETDEGLSRITLVKTVGVKYPGGL